MKIIPRFVNLSPLLLAGIREPITQDSAKSIPLLWKKFGPFINKIPHQTNAVAYGLCFHSGEISSGEINTGKSDSSNSKNINSSDMYYMAACEVSEFTDLQAELSPLIVPASKYAVFVHETHVSEIRSTIDYVFDQWLPQSGCKHRAQLVHFFERYGEEFCPDKGIGGIEIWLPLES